MINLIPKEEKKKMIYGFYFKLGLLGLIMASFFMCMLFIAILPSYFLSSAKFNIINNKLQAQKGEAIPLPDQETVGIIKDINHKLDLIERVEQNKLVVSQKIINAIILKKTPDIKIEAMTYQSSIGTGKIINIEGTAPSREALLLFRHTLEDDINFTKVDLPISNFVRGSNIKFSLSLMPRLSK